MKEFNESNLCFQFEEENWQVVKYDEENNYLEVSRKLQGTKAIDFLGIYNNKSLIFFEIKNFRGYGMQPKTQKRVASAMEDLSTEIAQKVKDTIAIICGINKNISFDENNIWCQSAEYLFNDKQIIVIAWIEEDDNKQVKAEMATRTDKLKQKLSWLTNYVYIDNVKANHLNFEGFKITSI